MHFPPELQEHIYLKGITGNRMPARACHLNITMGGYEFPTKAFVADLEDELILGADFILRYKLVLDFDYMEVLVRKQDVHVPMKMLRTPDQQMTQVSKVRLQKRVRVPPRSEIQVLGSTNLEDEGAVVFEGKGKLKGLATPRLLTNASKNILVVLTNTSDSPKLLKKGRVLGIATQVDIPEPESEPDSGFDDAETEQPETVLLFNVNVKPNVLPPGGPYTDLPPSVYLQQQSINETLKEMSRDDAIKRLEARTPPHIRELFVNSCEHLTTKQCVALHEFLLEFIVVFAKDDKDLGAFDGIKHKINTGDALPVRESMRRTPQAFQGEEEKHLNDMLEAGVIRESSSDWASAPVLVRKRDGSVRYCIDYRKLNNVTFKDAFPLPRIQECLDCLSGNQFLSTLDLQSGYWQLFVDPDDVHKTAFITKYGLFEHIRLPFGLCNSPATFSRVMQLLLRGLSWKIVLAYLDDVVVLGKSFEDHLENLRAVFSRLKEHNLKLKPRKCSLFQREITFLGRKITQEGVSVTQVHKDKVVSWPVPRTVNEVEQFLGFMNYHRDFIPHYGAVSACLYERTGGKAKYSWPPECQEAFESLKKLLLDSPTLGFPRDDRTFVLDTDASDVEVSGALYQVTSEEDLVPISFGSYNLKAAQRKYCATRKELLAVVTFTDAYRHYLLGKPFIVRTDHNSLTWLLRFKHIQGQLARWLEQLSQYDLRIVHRAGKDHVNADALSRIPDPLERCDNYEAGVSLTEIPCGRDGNVCKYCTRAHEQWSRFEENVDDVIPLAYKKLVNIAPVSIRALYEDEESDELEGSAWVPGHSRKEIADLQQGDPALRTLIEWLAREDDTVTESEFALAPPAAKRFWQCRPQLKLANGVLYYTYIREYLPSRDLLMVPRKLVPDVLRMNHDIRLAGHLSMKRTYERLKNSFLWHHMHSDCETYIKNCNTCATQKKSNRTARAPLQMYQVSAPLERVHIDVLGPFVKSKNGNVYVLMLIDQFSKWLECYAIPDTKAETVAKRVVDEFIARFGCPLEIFTDQGSNFNGKLFRAICELLEIAKLRTTPYHPQSNGVVERYNQLVCSMIRCFIRGSQTEWDQYLPQLVGAVRSSPSRITGFSPNMLMLGREVTQPADIMFKPDLAAYAGEAPAEYVTKLRETLANVHDITREHLHVAQNRQKRTYDQRVHYTKFSVGDIVYRLNKASKVKSSNKLKAPWEGPFIVTQIMSPVLVKIRNRKREFVCHHNNLATKPLREIPLWIQRLRHKLTLDTHDEVLDDQVFGDSYDLEDLFAENTPDVSLPSVPKRGRPRKQPVVSSDTAQVPPVTSEPPAEVALPPVVSPPCETRGGRKRVVPDRYKDYTT